MLGIELRACFKPLNSIPNHLKYFVCVCAMLVWMAHVCGCACVYARVRVEARDWYQVISTLLSMCQTGRVSHLNTEYLASQLVLGIPCAQLRLQLGLHTYLRLTWILGIRTSILRAVRRVFYLSPSTLLFEAGCLDEPGSYWFPWVG